MTETLCPQCLVRRFVKTGMLMAVAATCTVANAQDYSVMRLGAGSATAINDSGQVVGSSSITGRATLWSGSTTIDLGDFTPTGVNDADQVSGYGSISGYVTTPQPVLWIGGTVTHLPTLTVDPMYPGYGSANAINNSGQVAGAVTNSDIGFMQAVVWNGTMITALGSAASVTSAQAINDAGQVVGSADFGNRTQHAAIWNGTTATDLGAGMNPRYTSIATSINDSGQIVGVLNNSATLFRQIPGGIGFRPRNLGTLGGPTSSANDINDAGDIVGQSDIPGGASSHAVLWTTGGGSIIDLNSEISPALALYVTLTDAVAINDLGEIAANGYNSQTGQYDAYLLSPATVSLPASAWLMLSGLGGLGALARRKRATGSFCG